MDNKEMMYFLRNMEAVKKENAQPLALEYEVIGDTTINVELNYGPYEFKKWEYSGKQEGEERKFILAIKEVEGATPKGYSPTRSKKEKESYYHGGGIPDELLALMSLFLRRRLRLGPIVRFNDKPLMVKTNRNWIDEGLIKNQNDVGELSYWFNLVRNLKVEHHKRFMLATRLYQKAILTIEEEPDLAYLNLISAVEALAGSIENELTSLEEHLPIINNLLAEIGDEKLRSNLSNEIEKLTEQLRKNSGVTKKFIKIIEENVTEEFWVSESDPEHKKITKQELHKFLSNIYTQRSKTLHEGKPFPPYIFFAPFDEVEMDFTHSLGNTSKQWGKENIPLPHFFERLVNHVLKTFLKRHQVNGVRKQETEDQGDK